MPGRKLMKNRERIQYIVDLHPEEEGKREVRDALEALARVTEEAMPRTRPARPSKPVKAKNVA
jgi:hypothetical protein